jgi:hypothetical protein
MRAVDLVFAVLLLDVWRCDDRLEAGRGIGQRVGDEEVTAWSPADGYTLNRVYKLPVTRVRPVIDFERRRFGAIEVDLHDDGRAIVGDVIEAPVDLEALGLEGAPADAPTDTISTGALAPFPVTIDVHEGRIVPTRVVLPNDVWTLVAGMKVRTDGGDEALVLATYGDVFTLRSTQGRTADIRLPNPENRVVPLGFPLGAVSLLAIGAMMAVRRRDVDRRTHVGR